MFEEKYSYSVIAKKLGHSNGWVSKWTMDKVLEDESGGIFAKSKSAPID